MYRKFMKELQDKMCEIGSRIESEGYLGTVRFVGEVPTTKGDWLGVEWDVPDRGKHDGVHEGVRYFTTSHPNAGSFIRPKKASMGVSFVEALEQRYGAIEDEHAGVDVEEMFVLGKNQQTTVQVVGARSVNSLQSQFDRLLEVVLRDTQVNQAGEDGVIQRVVPNVEILDISKNMISSWQRVAEIVQQLVHLKSLNLSENKLSYPDDSEELCQDFHTLKTVFLNRMKYTWQDVLQCTKMMRNLEQLHLCFNQISCLPELGPYLSNLRLLNFESNPLPDWSQILKVGTLPCLEVLILNDTGIDKIEFPDVSYGHFSSYFPQLKTLSITNNKIEKWRSINELMKLKNLLELTFRRNPLLKIYPEDSASRSIIHAKLHRVQTYNRSKITAGERRGSELDYVKGFGKEWRDSGGHQDPAQNKPSAEFTEEHPRYQELIEKFGPPEDYELLQQSTALKNSLISISIVSKNMPNKPSLKKKLPVSMTVQKLKTLIQRIYKADPITLKLSYVSEKMVGPEIEMESGQKEIGYYSIEEGDTVHVTW